MSDKEKNNHQDKPEKQSNFPTVSLPDSSAVIGGEIGPYKLLSVLGEGGFGIVYLAEQKHPVKRTVALKIIKPGMDTKQVIARFEAERQALALLDHPNIAHVFTAGSTEMGRPYFVMEYIKGSPITEYCDHHKLSIKERLKLFIQVCEAVQHAHQKGIIHRDIKPSNIVVTTQDGKSTPKIIDFGVAKAISMPLTEKTMFTQQGQLIGTPEYMSPEQADLKEKDIDTRTDIYSLGVVLYELLAGTLPFEPKTLREGGYAEIQRIIREQEPPRPSTKLSSLGENATKVAQSRQSELSTLVKSLHKELEWIPLMAIRKDRDQRYKTASDLAEDVQNYLDGNPLVAGPESAAYRFKKFVKKRKALISAIVVIVIILFVSLGIVINSNIKTKIARNEAEIESSNSKAVINFLNDELLLTYNNSIQNEEEITVPSVFKVMSEKIEGKFENKPIYEASIRMKLGSIFLSLEDYEQASDNFEEAMLIYSGQSDDSYLNSLLMSKVNYGLSCAKQGRFDEAINCLKETIEIDHNLEDAHLALGITYLESKQYERALGSLKEAINLGLKSEAVYKNLGSTYYHLERYEEAIEAYELIGELKPNRADTYVKLADIYFCLNKNDEAIENIIKAIDIKPDLRNTIAYKINIGRQRDVWDETPKLSVDTTPVYQVGEIRLNGNTLLSTSELLANMPSVYKKSAKSLSEDPELKIYDLRPIHDVILEPNKNHDVSARTMNGLCSYLLSVYESQGWAGIYIYIPSEYFSLNSPLAKEILPINIIETVVSSIEVNSYDESGMENSKEDKLSTANILELSPVKVGEKINRKALDNFLEVLNLDPLRYVAVTISKGDNQKSLAVNYNIYEKTISTDVTSGDTDSTSNSPQYKDTLTDSTSNNSQYEDTLKALRKAVNNDPNDAYAFNNLGVVYSRLDRSDEAMEAFNQAKDIKPNWIQPYINLAQISYSLNRFNDSEQLYKDALKIDGQGLQNKNYSIKLQIYRGLADSYYAQGKYKEAIDFYNQTLSLGKQVLGDRNPYLLDIMNWLAWTYYNLNNYEKAEHFFTETLYLQKNVLASDSKSDAKYSRLNFIPKQVARYRSTTETIKDFHFDQPSQQKLKEERTKTLVEMSYTQLIKGVDKENNATIEITIDELKVEIVNKNETKLLFDSTNDKDSPLFKLLGKSYTFKMSPYGQITHIDAKNASAVISSDYEKKITSSILGDDAICNRHQISFIPKDNTNSTWTWEKIVSSPPGLLAPKSYKKTYTLAGIENDIATIQMVGTESSEPVEDKRSGNGTGSFAKMFDCTDDYTGSAKFDMANGQVLADEENLISTYVSQQMPKDGDPNKGPDTLKMTFTFRIKTERLDISSGAEQLDRLGTMQGLANVFYKQAKYEEAATHYEELYNIQKQKFGAENEETLSSMHWLGVTYYWQNKYTEAKDIFSELVELRKNVLGAEHADTLESKEYLANTYYMQGDYEKALPLYTELFDVRKKTLGAEHADTLKSKEYLANTYYMQGEYEKAKQLYIQEIKIRTQSLGKENSDTLNSMGWLAWTYYSLGNYEKAEQLFTETLEIQKQVVGTEQSDTLNSMQGLARTYNSLNNFDKMISLLEEIIALKPDLADPYNTLARLYVTSTDAAYYKPGQGLELAQKAVSINKSDQYLDTLAVAFAANGDFEKAIEIEQEAIELTTNQQYKIDFSKRIQGFRKGKTYLQQKEEAIKNGNADK